MLSPAASLTDVLTTALAAEAVPLARGVQVPAQRMLGRHWAGDRTSGAQGGQRLTLRQRLHGGWERKVGSSHGLDFLGKEHT